MKIEPGVIVTYSANTVRHVPGLDPEHNTRGVVVRRTSASEYWKVAWDGQDRLATAHQSELFEPHHPFEPFDRVIADDESDGIEDEPGTIVRVDGSYYLVQLDHWDEGHNGYAADDPEGVTSRWFISASSLRHL